MATKSQQTVEKQSLLIPEQTLLIPHRGNSRVTAAEGSEKRHRK